MLKDLDTGRAMRETYKVMIGDKPYTATGRRKINVGYVMYADACQVGQHMNLGIEIFKFTLSLLNSAAREKAHAWRHLGYLPNRVKSKGKAEDLLRTATHVDAKGFLDDPRYRESVAPQSEPHSPNFGAEMYGGSGDHEEDDDPLELPEVKAQDLHVMLDAILASYGFVEDRGIEPSFSF